MSRIPDHPFATGKEPGFRRGFAQGARAAIDDLENILPDAQIARLRLWLTELDKWRAGGGAESEPPPLCDKTMPKVT